MVHINQYNLDKQNLNKKIGDVDEKIPNTSDSVTTTVLNTKVSEVKNKNPDNSKHITTQEINKLTAESFAARLKPADLVNKADFDNKLISFNKRVTSNNRKHVEVQKTLNSLITKYYNLFLGRTRFTSNYGSQNTFVYQPTLDTLEFKKDKCTDYVLS